MASGEAGSQGLFGSKRRRIDEPDDLSESDWTCHKCGNVNVASRTVCQSKTCGTYRIGSPPLEDDLLVAYDPPESEMEGMVDYDGPPAEGVVDYVPLSPRGEDKLLNFVRARPYIQTKDPKDRDWMCHKCLVINSPTSTNCRKCEAPHPHPPGTEEGYTGVVTDDGPAEPWSMMRLGNCCKFILAWEYIQTKDPEERDWLCHKCIRINSPSSTTCCKCQAPHPRSSASGMSSGHRRRLPTPMSYVMLMDLLETPESEEGMGDGDGPAPDFSPQQVEAFRKFFDEYDI